MTHFYMTQWIEDAEARQVRQAARWNQRPAVTESDYQYLGDRQDIVVVAPGHQPRGAGGHRLPGARLRAPSTGALPPLTFHF